MSKPLITSTLGWHLRSLPQASVRVLAINDLGDVGEAVHTGTAWRWLMNDVPIEAVACWAELPDGKAVLDVRDDVHAARHTWELTELGHHLISGEVTL